MRAGIVILLFLSLLASSGIISPPGAAAEPSQYELIADVQGETYYFDKKNMQFFKDAYSEELFLNAWVRTDYSPAKAKEILVARAAGGLPVKGYEQLKSIETHLFIRVAARQLQITATADFAADGTMLETVHSTFQPDLWRNIESATIGELWFNKITAYAAANDSYLRRFMK